MSGASFINVRIDNEKTKKTIENKYNTIYYKPTSGYITVPFDFRRSEADFEDVKKLSKKLQTTIVAISWHSSMEYFEYVNIYSGIIVRHLIHGDGSWEVCKGKKEKWEDEVFFSSIKEELEEFKEDLSNGYIDNDEYQKCVDIYMGKKINEGEFFPLITALEIVKKIWKKYNLPDMEDIEFEYDDAENNKKKVWWQFWN